MRSNKNSLNKQDIKEWLVQTIIYSLIVPVLVTFLTSIESGVNIKTAATVACISFLTAFINLLKKYQSGTPASPITPQAV